MKTRKIWNLIGMILGLVVILAGIVFFTQPADCTTTSGSELENTSFGGDFYTYEYKATRQAAHNAGRAANNVYYLSQAMAHYCGALFMLTGALAVVHYGKLYFAVEAEEHGPKPAKAVRAAAPAPSYHMPAPEEDAPKADAPAGGEQG